MSNGKNATRQNGARQEKADIQYFHFDNRTDNDYYDDNHYHRADAGHYNDANDYYYYSANDHYYSADDHHYGTGAHHYGTTAHHYGTGDHHGRSDIVQCLPAALR